MDLYNLVDLIVALLSIPAAYFGAVKASKSIRGNSRISKIEVRVSSTEKAVQAVLHDSLYNQCTSCIAKNKVTVSELDNIEHLYEGYKGVGGNGTGEALYTKVLGLPIVHDNIK